MDLAEIFALLIALTVGTLTLAAFLTVWLYLLPERAQQAQHHWRQQSRRAFVIGLVNLIFFGVLASILAQGSDFLGLIALLILLGLAALTAVGLTGLLLLLRGRMFGGDESVGAGGKTAVILILAALTPFVGWFLLAPIALITSLGAAILALANRGK